MRQGRSHILINMVPPKATAEEMMADLARADSISAIMKGSDFNDGEKILGRQGIGSQGRTAQLDLLQYFKKHKKQYKVGRAALQGHGLAMSRDEADVAAVRNAVKGLPFGDWADKLRSTFNNDSVIRIRVEGHLQEG